MNPILMNPIITAVAATLWVEIVAFILFTIAFDVTNQQLSAAWRALLGRPKRLTLREAIAAHNEPYNPNVRHWTRGGCDDHE